MAGHTKLSAIVTTVRRGQRYTEANRSLAARTAKALGILNVPRGNDSLEELRSTYDVDAVLVARQGLLTLVTAEGELFFHPGMAHLRIKNLLLGHGDHLVRALGLAEGLRVLDTDSDDFDGTRAMNRELRYEFLRLRRARLRKILRYVMDALTSAGVTVAGLLLLRILYWHAG